MSKFTPNLGECFATRRKCPGHSLVGVIRKYEERVRRSIVGEIVLDALPILSDRSNTVRFLRDERWHYFQRGNEPGKLFQNWWISTSGGTGWNFGRVRQYSYIDLESVWTFKNFWGSFVGYEYFPPAQSDNLTRGGPLMGTGESWNAAAELWSSGKNKTTWNGWTNYSEDEFGGWSGWLGGGLTVRPGSRWQISLNPRYNRRISSRQYIDTQSGGTNLSN